MKRRGMTLVEVMVTVALSTFVMGILVAVVSRLLVSNTAAHDHLQNLTTLGRLGEQFRSDAHAATDVHVERADKQPQRLTFHTADQSAIAYTIVPEGLRREVSAGDDVRQRELFVFAGMKPLGWQSDAQRREIALSIGRLAHPQREDDTIAGKFSIVAALPAEAELVEPEAPRQEPAGAPAEDGEAK